VRFDDPELVAREYASEERFAARRAVFSDLVEGETAVDRGLGEIERVLGPRGRLVAATFSAKHLLDLYEWLGDPSVVELEFSSENGADPLRRHFARVERRDAEGSVVFPDRDSVHTYLSSLIRGRELADLLPQFEGEFGARSRQSILVADKT
jgi:hypothetical protein